MQTHTRGLAHSTVTDTVSRVIAWARDIGLVVTVEHAASAEFLGTDHGRTPTYALVTNTPLPPPPSTDPTPGPTESAQLTLAVEESGDLPASSVENKPLNGRRLEPTAPAQRRLAAVPSTRDRSRADRRSQPAARTTRPRPRRGIRVPLWRTRALLKPWWDAGACPAALLWAIDHHPDRPDHHRGDALAAPRPTPRPRRPPPTLARPPPRASAQSCRGTRGLPSGGRIASSTPGRRSPRRRLAVPPPASLPWPHGRPTTPSCAPLGAKVSCKRCKKHNTCLLC